MDAEHHALLHHKPHSSTAQKALNALLIAGVIASLVLSILLAVGKLHPEGSNTTTTNNYYTNTNLMAASSYRVATIASTPAFPIAVYLHAHTITGSDGLPVVIVAEPSAINITKCHDTACQNTTSFATRVPPYSSTYAPIVGSDGLVMLPYFAVNSSYSALIILHCENINCDKVSLNELDSTNSVGWEGVIHIAADGNPIVTYMDNGNRTIKVAHCTDAACAKPATFNSITSFNGTVEKLNSAFGLDGNLVLFITSGSGDLVAAHCLDLMCTQMDPYTVIGGGIGNETGVVIYIGYTGTIHLAVSGFVLTCTNIQCSTVSAATLPFNGSYAATVDITGLPLIAMVPHSFSTTVNMNLIACMDEACTSTITRTNVYPKFNQSVFTNSMSLGSNGFPMITSISMTPVESGAIEVVVVTCGNHMCTPWKN